jgi:flagellar biogenesis protein FliO
MPASFWAGYILRLAIVGVVLGALYTLARLLRTLRMNAPSGRCVSVVESTILSPHATLHLLRVGERYMLLGSGSVCVIGEVEPSEVPKR